MRECWSWRRCNWATTRRPSTTWRKVDVVRVSTGELGAQWVLKSFTAFGLVSVWSSNVAVEVWPAFDGCHNKISDPVSRRSYQYISGLLTLCRMYQSIFWSCPHSTPLSDQESCNCLPNVKLSLMTHVMYEIMSIYLSSTDHSFKLYSKFVHSLSYEEHFCLQSQ